MNNNIDKTPDATNGQPETKKPRTEAQREAARINGAKSHGPTSDEGKAVSSRNASKHRFYAEVDFEDPAEAGELRQQIEAYEARFQPENPDEFDLCRELAIVNARLQRNHIIQAGLWDMALVKGRKALLRDFVPPNPDAIRLNQLPERQIAALAAIELDKTSTWLRLDREINRLQTRFLVLQDRLLKLKRERDAITKAINEEIRNHTGFCSSQAIARRNRLFQPSSNESNPGPTPVRPSTNPISPSSESKN